MANSEPELCSGSSSVSDSISDSGSDEVIEKPWFCYMLASLDGRKTYVGATIDPDRRLRQHNGQLSGGARATKGRVWKRVFLVGGFVGEKAALRFEWRWKYLTRQAPGDTFIERRSHALSLLLSDFPFAEVIES